jgi:hypothetical protein
MDIARQVVPRLPNLRAVIFEIMPERVEGVGLAAIAEQLGRLKDIWLADRADCVGGLADRPPRPTTTPALTPQAWEDLLGCACAGLPGSPIHETLASWWLSAAPALDLYRLFVGEGRASAVAVAAPRTIRSLLEARGDAGVRGLLADFWRQSPPNAVAADEARSFLRFLTGTCADPPNLAACITADEEALALF